ncbi:Zinc finger, RING/FYVE/PHD-type [Artemisia annua]|uniref:Zinc finger, RING/FYVE/PHD-type n=1 Tax=Artemisia annua TaxID=35608 RepID=A0A2U1PUK7_ARTAN|nr:Zinc finger, RING/FYVE/PHD-type [Artemisia annua]
MDDEQLVKMTSPVAADSSLVKGVVIIDDDALLLYDSKSLFNSNSLPCGHMYGSSCINKWLQQSSRSSRKCPQCNTLCKLKDVRPLQATCLSISKHKDYVLQRRLVALRLTCVSSNWRVEVLKRAEDAADRLGFLSQRLHELLKYQTCADGSQADAFLQRADALKRRILPLARRAEALEQRAEALEQRASAFRHLTKAYLACIDYFTEMCKKLDLDAVLVGE